MQLETEPALLIPKSRAALARYGHQLVIGNDLHRRKHEVVFVERLTPNKGGGDERLRGVETPLLGDYEQEEFRETWVKLEALKAVADAGDGEGEIEELIIRELVRRHQDWMDAGER